MHGMNVARATHGFFGFDQGVQGEDSHLKIAEID